MISVIVPAYNAERWMVEAVESVSAQTYTDWELVLVDDGSVDGTGFVMDTFAGQYENVRVIHQSNLGVSAARNAGIAAAKGEWVTFLDADDVLCPEFLATMYTATEKTGADIVSSKISLFSGVFECKVGNPKTYTISPQRGIRSMWLQNGEIDASPCGKLFRKCLFEHEQFRPGIRYEDLDIMYRLFAESGKIAIVKGSLYGYRQHSGSFIHKYSPSRLDSLEVTSRMEQWAMRHDKEFQIDDYSGVPKRGLLRAAWDRRLSANFNVFIEVERARRRGEISEEEALRIESECYSEIRRLRINSLFGKGIRIKNRVGAMASYLGPGMLRMLAGK